MIQRIKTVLVAVIFTLSLITTPRPALAVGVITEYAQLLIMTEIVTTAVFLLLRPTIDSSETLFAQVTETPVAGGNTALSIQVDDTLWGESVQFSGSGEFSDTAGDFSGAMSVGTRTSLLDIINANINDANNPTMAGWDSIMTNVFTAGAAQLPVDVSNTGVTGTYPMILSPGESIVETTLFFSDPQRARFSFAYNPTADITTTFGPVAGQVTSEVLLTETVIPIPATPWLFGSALGLLAWLRRNKVT
jgi:hypothetical protein